MCGIAGFFNWDQTPANEGVAWAMEKRLVHRGPDAGGVFVDGPVALVNRRLRIIDVQGPDQPLFNEDRSVAVVLNGEIYNYRELRQDLLSKGHRLSTEGDTECLAHLYEEYGIEGCLERLNGMFGFALYDRRAKSLFVARDRLGIKPIYITETPKSLLFSSELKAFLDHPDFRSRINPRALLDAFVLRYIPGHHSIFEGASKLAPGHYLKVDESGEPRIHRYWMAPFDARENGDNEDANLLALEEEIQKSVARRLIAEVPIGMFLSGGIDSSLIVAEVARTATQPPIAITVGFENASIDERPVAKAIAKHLGVKMLDEGVSPKAASILGDVAYYFDEPFFDSSALPTYLLCAAARRYVTVVLSGDGGDENFAGYRRYRFDAIENRIRGIIPTWMRRSVFGTLAGVWPKGDYLPQRLRAKTLLSNLARDPFGAYLHSVSQMTRAEAMSLLNRDMREELSSYDMRESLEPIYNRVQTRDSLTKVLAFDFHTWLPDDILTKTDRASMAHSLEARVPFLDHELVSLASRMPVDMKLRHGEGKYLLRKLLESRVPKSLWDRPKQGFHAPVDEWIRGELKPFIERSASCPLLDGEEVRAALGQHLSGRRNRSAALWSALMTSCWYQHFGDGRIPEAPVAPFLRSHAGAAS